MTAKVTNVESFLLHVPFVERVRREMERAGVHTWSELEITRVETDAGIVGWGETIQNYTWGRVQAQERVIGRTPASLMWDDSLGAGLQMALLDATGKLAGVPAY
ncbi:MAG TPA: enolase, partial [Candidatus Latescibacteria bacterium]|nr:enolase [Candidatus Latescibacterota bacterium]